MPPQLASIFDEICPPPSGPLDRPLYAVVPVPGHASYFVGKDRELLACLLISVSDNTSGSHPPIRLESLDAQFRLRCHFTKASKPTREGTFTVIRCRDSDSETIRYFFSVCETILGLLGNQPRQGQVAVAVNRLASIFQRVRQPRARPLNGLFGELYLLHRSYSPVRALAAWRSDQNARFDFSCGDVRIEVKATGGRNRLHSFSYNQCNPPSGTVAIVASLYAEQIAGGTSLGSIMSKIESQVSAHLDLVLKLHETVAATLGVSLNESLARRFDMRLAESSLRFFWLEDVPAVRGPLPEGVSDVHFRSDLSTLPPVSIGSLIGRDPLFWDLLPREGGHSTAHANETEQS